MNILLTGSGGFIGSHIKAQLGAAHSLLTPRSRELNLMDEKAVDKYFDENQIDFIIHSAAVGVRITPDATPESVATPNIQMFNNLARHTNKNCKMIVFGSGAEYDKRRPLIKIKESEFGESVPIDPYGYSKYMISREMENFDDIINLRIFGIYGFGESPTRVTSCIINDNLAHRPIVLNQNVVFDFIYIDDFCKIVEQFVNNFPRERFINVASGNGIEIIDLARIVNDFSDYKSDIIIKNPGMNKEYTADNSLLQSILKTFKFTTYQNGMRAFYEGLAHERG